MEKYNLFFYNDWLFCKSDKEWKTWKNVRFTKEKWK